MIGWESSTPFPPAWHPESNGGAEIFMKFLKSRMQIFIKELRKDWDEHLSAIVLAHNAGCLSWTNYSPFELMFGRSLRHTPTDLANPVEERTLDLTILGEEMGSIMKSCWERAREDHLAAKALQEKWANASRKPRTACEFQVGDLVLLHAPIRSDSKRNVSSKLKFAWKGPFEVVRCTRDAVFILKDARTGKETDEVHADRLTPFRGERPRAPSEAPASVLGQETSEPLRQGELLLVRTDHGHFLAKVWAEAQGDEDHLDVHWLNSRSKKSTPLHLKKFKESHFDPRDGKAVFTNRPPAGFEPELGVVHRRDVVERALVLNSDGSLSSNSSSRVSNAVARGP